MSVSTSELFSLAAASTPDGEARLAEAEALLAAAWGSALRGKLPGRSRPFWALGINANRALDILRYLWLEARLEPHINIFLEAPTIRAMAARLADHSASEAQCILPMGGAAAASIGSGAAAAPIGSGAAAPGLFLFPGGGGFLHELAELARAFDNSALVHGVTASGTDGCAAVNATHQDEAIRAAALIRQTQPAGPYNIAGYSLGGCTALETARILRKAGEDVQLMLLDSSLNERCWPVAVWLRYLTPHFLRRVAGRLRKKPAAAHDGARKPALPKLAAPQRGTMFEFRFRDPRHPDYPLYSPHWQSFHPPHYTKMRARAITMHGRYRPEPYDGPVTFFVSRGGDQASCSPRDIWPKYLPNAEWQEVSGNHTSMIMGRHARQLAREMGKRLKK